MIDLKLFSELGPLCTHECSARWTSEEVAPVKVILGHQHPASLAVGTGCDHRQILSRPPEPEFLAQRCAAAFYPNKTRCAIDDRGKQFFRSVIELTQNMAKQQAKRFAFRYSAPNGDRRELGMDGFSGIAFGVRRQIS